MNCDLVTEKSIEDQYSEWNSISNSGIWKSDWKYYALICIQQRDNTKLSHAVPLTWT